MKISRFQAFGEERGQIRDSCFPLYAPEDLVYPHSRHTPCPLWEAYAELDRTLGVLVDLTVCFDALLERDDWRYDAFCAQTA